MENESQQASAAAHPLLKWAGGKKQLLNLLLPKVPSRYGRYIEPFFGGGALFFALQPVNGIISDSNPELVNLYQMVADHVDEVTKYLKLYENSKEDYYIVRAQDWTKLEPEQAAARMIYLNRTCYNGLYRVNRNGQFNVPYGRHINPRILDEEGLKTASQLLKGTDILCGDYKEVLGEHARSGDFIFLDPPYLPVSTNSDFKRYTKEQFYEEDHRQLATEVERLHEMGCHVVLTNSNHPLVQELYGRYAIEIIQTKRYISSVGSRRSGEDVIVTIEPEQKFIVPLKTILQPKQVSCYPSTRYMGSKNKLLDSIWAAASQFEFETVADLFSGSGVVGYMLKAHGKEVLSNDYMSMASTYAKAMIENSKIILPRKKAEILLTFQQESDHFVENTFDGLYFTKEENCLIDTLRTNIASLKNSYERAIAMSALMRACTKKRPRGIFTYVGERYLDGRKDLQLSLEEQFLLAVDAVNGAVFDNGRKNRARNGNAMTYCGKMPDLVYLDPPYYSPYSDNEYVRRYHFLEGLARDWKGVEIQQETLTKKFKSYPTPFSTRKGTYGAFDRLFHKYSKSILIISYSSNSLPSRDEMVELLSKYKNKVEVVPLDYRYSFGNQGERVGDNNNEVKEYLFIGY